MAESVKVDVAILGGGLAGLSAALLLRREQPELTVALVERSSRPLPEAAHKVGESTVEGGSYFLRELLGLDEHIRGAHIQKLGLRFFWGGSSSDLLSRAEAGAFDYKAVGPSFQLDRGLLENYMRERAAQTGVHMFEGHTVTDVELRPDAEHRVRAEPTPRGAAVEIAARWVIDAMGRRLYLQRKLGLKEPSWHDSSACWWRTPGKVDVSTLVDREDVEFHRRIAPGRERWLSTVHLMGAGYWVWLIPLSSNYTSIGIVADETAHPIRERSSYEKARAWLREHEPQLAGLLQSAQPIDFLALRRFSHLTTQAFGWDRWACIGEAAAFTDPLYSNGTDAIAMGAEAVSSLIALDRRGELDRPTVDDYNALFLEILRCSTETFAGMYPTLGTELPCYMKLMWDFYYYWGGVGPVSFHRVFSDPVAVRASLPLWKRLTELHRSVQKLLAEWAEAGPSPLPRGRSWPPEPAPLQSALRHSQRPGDPRSYAAHLGEIIDRLEELASLLLVVAVTDVHPDRAAGIRDAGWIDPARLTLDPERWSDGPAADQTRVARDLSRMGEDVCALLGPMEARFQIRSLIDQHAPR